MSVVFGLATALCWGLADFAVVIVSRRLTALQVTIGMHVGSVVFAGILAGVVADTGSLGVGQLWPFALAGLLGCATYLAFFKALSLGPVCIVSPIVSASAAVTVMLAMVVLGERPGGLQLGAIAVVLVGVVLASSDYQALAQTGFRALWSAGILLALVAMVLMGGYVFAVAYFADAFGWLLPILLVRAFSAIFFVGGSLAARYTLLQGVTAPLACAMLLIGVVETAAYMAFSLGVRIADTSLVATIAAAYTLVPIALSVILLGERPVANQWAGVALVVAGVAALGATA